MTMKKIKKIHWLLTMLLTIGSVSMYAQFDDLYFDEDEAQYATYDDTEELADADYDDAFLLEEEEAYDYDEDEYDEYLSYRENDYNVDAYRYTNRFRDNRYSNFYARSGYSFDPLFSNSYLGPNPLARPGVRIGLSFGSLQQI